MADPPIGIFAFGSSPIAHMPGERTRALLAEAALQGANLLFFETEDCEPGIGRIRANRWTRTGWVRSEADLPGLVVIITNPITERHRAIDTWLRGHARIVGFHNHSKLELAGLTEASPLAKYVIPYAKLDAGSLREQLVAWLAAGAAVVKPIDGMRGSGIQFAMPSHRGWTLTKGEKTWPGEPSDIIARIETSIRGRMRYRDYMVQRYIDSRDESGRAAAIRIDIVRLPEGGWAACRFSARLAGTGMMISNLMAGASQTRIENFLAGRAVRSPQEISHEALWLAETVADSLNRNPATEPNFEYGVDIAIDHDDRLWLIEANGQPQGFWAEHDRAVLVIAYLLSLTA